MRTCGCVLMAIVLAGALAFAQATRPTAPAANAATAEDSRLCVIRTKSTTFSDFQAPVKTDGGLRGTLSSGTFVCFATASGTRTLEIGEAETVTNVCEENRPGEPKRQLKRIKENYYPLIGTIEVSPGSEPTYVLVEPLDWAPAGCREYLNLRQGDPSSRWKLLAFKRIAAKDAVKLMSKYRSVKPASSSARQTRQ